MEINEREVAMTTGLQKARGLGVPRTAEERVAAHYGITIEEARRWLQIHPESELLPERGAGLPRGTAAGSIGNEVPPECPSCLPSLLIGFAFGGIIGAGFAMILQKEYKELGGRD
ncbi:hypothetical protein ES703_112565 [subsurface metagenome]